MLVEGMLGVGFLRDTYAGGGMLIGKAAQHNTAAKIPSNCPASLSFLTCLSSFLIFVSPG
jgi:hypothetical protein